MTRDEILQLARSYQGACVLAAAADLDLFPALAGRTMSAPAIAAALRVDVRGLAVVLDALVALRILEKSDGRYALPDGLERALGGTEAGSVLSMARHQANCLRQWARLAEAVKTGTPPERRPSVRGGDADADAFIGAMDDISAPRAAALIRELPERRFRHLLDVGGASGTWTIAFLEESPAATATLFDLPHVMPMAAARLAAAGLRDRVTLAPGDFSRDPLPRGADFAWVSAIVHMNSRTENCALFRNVFDALEPDGSIAIRDVIMEPSRTEPPAGALFAVNMLVHTPGGGTYTFEELREDLESAGFRDTALVHRDQAMDSLIVARRPTVAGHPATPS